MSRRIGWSTATVEIRPAAATDLPGIIELDEEVTGLGKPSYWQDTFERFGTRQRPPRFFLIAAQGEQIQGFVVGEVRAWEFGSPPCGWIFAIQVHPRTRLKGIGTELFDAICTAFRQQGVDKVRTMLARDNHLLLSFFRSQGMMAGPFIELESALE